MRFRAVFRDSLLECKVLLWVIFLGFPGFVEYIVGVVGVLK